MYVNKTKCQWRTLPADFGHWQTVYGYSGAGVVPESGLAS
jgi:transposase